MGIRKQQHNFEYPIWKQTRVKGYQLKNIDEWFHYWHHSNIMANVTDIISSMKESPNNVKFSDACKVAEHFFNKPRQDGSSHKIYKMPWRGDPRINLQNLKGKAKPYQVKQLLQSIEKLENLKKQQATGG